jgi:peptidoglycan/LPS O-acetylase OafA/YrhL
VNRVRALDGLRGAAALIVFIYHCLYFTLGREVFVPGVSWVWNGQGAVFVFFALSGYALASQLSASGSGVYLIRRLCRLYPAILATELLFLAAYWGLPRLGVDWHPDAEPGGGVFYWLLLAPRNFSDVDSSMWSLQVEIYLSLAFPAIWFLLLRLSWRVTVAALAVMLAALAVFPYDKANNWMFFAILFPMGALCRQHHDALAVWIPRHVPRWYWLILLVLLSPNPSVQVGGLPLVEIITDLASVLLLLAAAFEPGFRRFLEHKLAQHLGRISFSLYLVHWLPVTIFLVTLRDRLNVAAGVALAFAVSLALAELLYLLVERPGIVLGRRLAGASTR